jgi:hypothetical protein
MWGRLPNLRRVGYPQARVEPTPGAGWQSARRIASCPTKFFHFYQFQKVGIGI